MTFTKQTAAKLRARPRISHWVFWTMALLLVMSGASGFAQYDNGSVVGTIHDSTGSAVPNATITITNNATGVSSVVRTSASGDYEAPSLRVGVYMVSASAAGYATAEARNITVSVGARERIDLVLKVGSTQTTVEVSDVALQLQTESSERDQTITGYQSAALPLVSRNFSDLLALVAGSRQAPTQAMTSAISSLVREGSYNVNGQRSIFNNYLLDGMDNNAYGESNQGFDNQIIAVPPDSVAQFAVVTNNENAEYGRSSGATVNVASASGSNQYPRHALRIPPQHRPECRRFLQADSRGRLGNQPAVSEAGLQPQSVRHELGRPHPQRQALLLSRL